jgi:hypothetical protein
VEGRGAQGKRESGRIQWMYFASIYENRRIKPVEIVQEREGGRRETEEGINLRYIISTYINIIMYPSVQPLYVNTIK